MEGWQARLMRTGCSITGYVPCYNNATTIGLAIRSLAKQTVQLPEVLVVDDGSTDASRDRARAIGARVTPLERNLGRGSVRARAMEECQSDLVLCCDATCALKSDFLKYALPCFDDPAVAAVFGVYGSENDRTAADRWRSRHLFKTGAYAEVDDQAAFATYGALVRRAAVMEVGNYNESLRHSEDKDLGVRLRRAGFRVLRVPECKVTSTVSNSIWKALERYCRWYDGAHRMTLRHYVSAVAYSWKVMAPQDLQAGDMPSLGISLLCPHVQFVRGMMSRSTAPLPDAQRRS